MARVDIDFSFKKHPLTGDISLKKGASAINQSIRNIVLTDFYERGFQTDLGGNLNATMFENISLLGMQVIRDNILNALKNFEPGCEVLDVQVIDNDDNSINVIVYYTLINSSVTQEVTIGLSRLR